MTQANFCVELDQSICQAADDAPVIGFSDGMDYQEVPQSIWWGRVRQMASALASKNIAATDHVVIVSNRPEVVSACFLACIVLGAVPGISSPRSLGRDAGSQTRLACRAHKARFLVSDDEALIDAVACKSILVSELDLSDFDEADLAEPSSSLCYVQFTSGTTGSPAIVPIEHGQLLANLESGVARLELDPESDSWLSWLPFHHDMGLVLSFLLPLWHSMSCYFLRPVSFLRRPINWLTDIDRLGITVSFAPNFAYEQVAGKLAAGDYSEIDLSRWRIAGCGGELIEARTIERWIDAAAPLGMTESHMFPAYGLAQSVVGVSIPHIGHDLNMVERAGHLYVSCGPPVPGTTAVIEGIDDAPFSGCGEILIAGPSVIGQGWYRTGDIGFMVDGELFPVGRRDNLLAVNGSNISCEAIEGTISTHVGLPITGIAAFGVRSRGSTALLIYVDRKSSSGASTGEIRELVSNVHNVASEVHQVSPTWFIRTTSGKLRRQAMALAHLEREDSNDDDHPRRDANGAR